MSVIDSSIAPADVSLVDMIRWHARTRPNHPAWLAEGIELSWQDFDRAVNRVAHALITRGIKQGDRVAVISGPSVWVWLQVFGIIRAGGVCAPLNTMLNPESLGRMIQDTAAVAVIVGEGYESLAFDAIQNLGANKPALLGQKASKHIADFSSEVELGSTEDPRVSIAPDDLCNIIYSSGTTGMPKGIAHSHRMRRRMAGLCAQMFRTHCNTRMLLATPPHTNGSWMIILPTLYAGGTLIQSAGFSATNFLQEMHDYKPTSAFVVPTMAQVICAEPASSLSDWSCWEMLVTAGAPMPVPLKQQIQKLSDSKLMELWGFTEGVGTYMPASEMAERLDSVGRAWPECDIRVVDSEGNELPFGQIGELVGRSSMMMSGYWNRPDANQEIIWLSPTGEVYLRTGDLGEMNPDGYVTLRGRLKDMIVSGGLNVYPVDIESVLIEHADVIDCAVVGVPHAKWGEVPVAFVRLAEGTSPAAEHLKDWLNARVNKHERVLALQIEYEDFPRNTLGKVLKRELAQNFQGVA